MKQSTRGDYKQLKKSKEENEKKNIHFYSPVKLPSHDFFCSLNIFLFSSSSSHTRGTEKNSILIRIKKKYLGLVDFMEKIKIIVNP